MEEVPEVVRDKPVAIKSPAVEGLLHDKDDETIDADAKPEVMKQAGLVAMPFAPSSVLAPNMARSPDRSVRSLLVLVLLG